MSLEKIDFSDLRCIAVGISPIAILYTQIIINSYKLNIQKLKTQSILNRFISTSTLTKQSMKLKILPIWNC